MKYGLYVTQNALTESGIVGILQCWDGIQPSTLNSSIICGANYEGGLDKNALFFCH